MCLNEDPRKKWGFEINDDIGLQPIYYEAEKHLLCLKIGIRLIHAAQAFSRHVQLLTAYQESEPKI